MYIHSDVFGVKAKVGVALIKTAFLTPVYVVILFVCTFRLYLLTNLLGSVFSKYKQTLMQIETNKWFNE